MVSLNYGQKRTVIFDPSTAYRFIQAFEQFGKYADACAFPVGKIFEMVSLPKSIDRQEYYAGTYCDFNW